MEAVAEQAGPGATTAPEAEAAVEAAGKQAERATRLRSELESERASGRTSQGGAGELRVGGMEGTGRDERDEGSAAQDAEGGAANRAGADGAVPELRGWEAEGGAGEGGVVAGAAAEEVGGGGRA